jgi:CPA2 family monovalent cation:H+ antiporter-2
MFGVGLQFHVEELLAVRRVAVPGAIAQSAGATVLGTLLGVAVGWDWASGLVFGMALSVASTVVLVRVLADNNDLHTQSGHIAVGWLVVEDLFTIVALVLLPAFFAAGAEGSLWRSLGVTAVKVTLLIAFTATIGTRVIPTVLDYVARTRSRELFTLTVLVLALGIAVGSAAVFSVSMALGAFLAGMVVGRSPYSLQAASDALPMRDAFAVLFFVSVGMLLDPALLLEAPALLAGALAIVLVGKPLVALILIWLMRYPVRTALTVAVALAQIGEFSFILSTIGRDLGILNATAANTLVAVAMISIVINPVLYRATTGVERWIAARPGIWRLLNRAGAAPDAPRQARTAARYRAVVIGYGPTGRTVSRLLRENGIAPTIVELNIDTVRALTDEGNEAIYGDATQQDTLAAAGAADAGTLILTSAGMAQGAEVIRTARRLNPAIRVLARAQYLADLPPLQSAGASRAYSGEGEVALAFIEDIMEALGATPEQIDRERDRAHRELTGISS